MEGQLNLFAKPEFSINKKIRLIELFAGYGSQSMGLEMLGVPFESHFVCEFDKYAIGFYNAAHGTNFETSDVTKITGKDLNFTEQDKYCYIMTYSFPCLTSDSLILTKDGYKELKDVNVGDTVLTKSNTWHKVAKKFDNGVHDTCYINSFGFKKIHCTLNHKFYVREMYRKFPHLENGKRGNYRYFKEPTFKEVKDITRKDYFGVPVIQEEIPFYTADLDFWYLIGYYIGDGWLSARPYDIRFACNDEKLEKLKSHLDIKKWNYKINDIDYSCHKLRFSNKELYEFIEKYIGTGAKNKRIPGEILTLPKKELEAFLSGYIDSDGNTNKSGKNEYIRISSINENLIYSTAVIIEKLYHRPVSINIEKPRKKDHFINGRQINCNYPLMELKFKHVTNKQDKAFFEDGYIWYPFYNIELAEKEHVYNLEIEEDHSYIVNGCISKNCTDLSVAGKQEGMRKGSGTRSGLLWEVERLLNECKALQKADNKYGLPDVLLMENVTQVHGKKNIEPWTDWVNFLTELGYSNYYHDMNAKNYGVAQNRDRTFMVSILGNYDYQFPKEIPLTKLMADYLDEEVDEKFYINNDKAKALILNLIERGELPEKEENNA